jgi:peptidoglycan/xylan/chitin deacetylase (PgdA/CDA1 family)
MKDYYKRLKSQLSFLLGRNPVIEKPRKDYRNFIPQPYEGVVIISADFELAWAWRYAKSSGVSALSQAEKLALRERENIPLILSLCHKYHIPITWATVGHLFLESCEKKNNTAHPNLKRIPYFQNKWWDFNTGDWFDSDPCSNQSIASGWYAPDLIRNILDSEEHHEIACHTFSHIPCTDEICSPDILESDIKECIKLAGDFGISLKSFVFPGHTMGNFETIHKMGFTSVRTNYTNVLGYPEKDQNGLWRFPATMELNYNSNWSEKYNIYRYSKIIDRTINNKLVCNLWFHPSMSQEVIHKIFEPLAAKLNSVREKIWITTMKEYTAWLENANLKL